jgi:hypothetical protein
MVSRFGLFFTIVPATLLACAGVVLAQSTEPDPEQATEGEELVAPPLLWTQGILSRDATSSCSMMVLVRASHEVMGKIP